MKIRHTPGPWITEINPTISQGKQIAAYSEDGNRALQVIVSSFNTAEDMALIAAAPDLLDALKDWIDLYGGPDYEDCFEVAKTRAAIAKATGEGQ